VSDATAIMQQCARCSRRFESRTPHRLCPECNVKRGSMVMGLGLALLLVSITLLVGWLASQWLRGF
jgi:Zn finger protein HypA/HybF involved in hydrogenase expression